jgi:hypothetical protein
MGDVIRFRKPDLKDKAKAVTLCRHGHHKWVIDPKKQFDVKTGKLVTLYRCGRCNATRTTLT